MSSSTVADRLLTSLKNNRYLAIVVVAATIIIAVAQFSGALRELRTLIWSDAGRARTMYQTLALDLRSTEDALTRFTFFVSRESGPFQAHVRPVLIAADPVCAAKKGLAELGDADTRAEIDVICAQIETFKYLADPQVNFDKRELRLKAYAELMARRISRLRQKLAPQS